MLFSVNINKLATLRNSRGGNNPDLIKTMEFLVDWGIRGITIHPRPDERHITQKDTRDIASWIHNYNRSTQNPVDLNIEGYPSPEHLNLLLEVKPHQATFVPDKPEDLTSQSGWDLESHQSFLKEVVSKVQNARIRCSLFIEVQNFNQKQREALEKILPERIEMYTEPYAKAFALDQGSSALEDYLQVAHHCKSIPIGVHAGHDLNQQNLPLLLKKIPFIKEVSIGHAFICESLFDGLQQTTLRYLQITG